jgi:glycosyltransferase involved in cell wall biosynthesis
MLDLITPVILTYNEAPNIARTLAALEWARDIVVVDSFSNDATLQVLNSHPNVRVHQRAFTAHAEQWNFAIEQTGIATPWILALDADHVLSAELVEELARLQAPEHVDGYFANFQYCVFGRPLRGSLYPPLVALFRKGRGRYVQDGHTQRLRTPGPSERLRNLIRHDDRKPLSRWLASQDKYMQLEASKLLATPTGELALPDRIRKMVFVAPPLVFLYSYFVKGAVLDGRAGLYYSMQRTVAEMILSLHIIHRLFDPDRR